MFDALKDCWFLSGATASGKTTAGLALGKRIDAEIISLDSMSIYKDMDIGTAKPTPAQRDVIPHHLLDIVSPTEEFSLASYVDMAHECAREIQSRGKQVLFVGGTPLYLKSLLRGLSEGPPADWDFRREVEEEVDRVGVEALHKRLQQVDPLAASKLPPGDVRRIIRALEVYKHTGQPISHTQLQFDEGTPAGDCRVFVLNWPRPEIHRRIEERVDRMFEGGLIDEVIGLRDKYSELSRTALQAVGYREVMEHLDGEAELVAATERVKTRTRRFAKRQGTWFRGLCECRFIDMTEEMNPEDIASQIYESGSNQ